jgi:tetratricopeptide (TPR) repeat protein
MSTELKREDERVLYEAGYLLLQKGNVKAAREVFEGLAAMTPNKGQAYLFLGTTYFAEEKFDEAVKNFRKAVELGPDNAAFLAHLGQGLYVTRQKDEATNVLKKAVAMEPDGPAGRMARGLLQLVGRL